MRKGEIACDKQFLLFSQYFLPYIVLIFHFKCTLKCRMSSAMCFDLDQSKILLSGNGLTHYHTITHLDAWLIEWCFTLLSTVFQSYHGDSSHYSCLSWEKPVLGLGSEVSCPRTLPWKNPEDPVWLKPRTPGLRVKHFTTEPRRTPHLDALKIYICGKHYKKRRNCL